MVELIEKSAFIS